MVGFAASGVWPGVSWAIGGSLAIVGFVVGARWLRIAIVGQSPVRHRPPERRGAM
jgi:hypothetical protein